MLFTVFTTKSSESEDWVDEEAYPASDDDATEKGALSRESDL